MIKPSAVTEDARTPTQTKGRRPIKRRQQQRAIDTQRMILDAALIEFAEKGFDGASLRRIGERAGVDFTLIGYHYRNKDALWRAVAENAFEEIQKLWNDAIPEDSDMPAVDRVRIEFRTFLRFTLEHSAFHHFMLRENLGNSPRLAWLLENLVARTRSRVILQIHEAQMEEHLIGKDPNLTYYLILGMVSVLSSLRGEMAAMMGFSVDDPDHLEVYWRLVEEAAFRT